MRAQPQFRDLDLFMRAAWDGDIPAMQRFITAFGREHVDTPRGGEGDYTALMWAAKNGNVASIGFLARNGADVNYADKAGDTPLHMAAWLGRLEAVDALLKRGANPDAGNHRGQTPAAYAATEGHPESAAHIAKFRRTEFEGALQRISKGTPNKISAPHARFRRRGLG